MPIYQCSFQTGLPTEDMKAKIAAAIIAHRHPSP
jgi:phenylpyruvate tautomerase PptA (4-oxalocrotonate tautomerase family)